jgi:hypothetical protein
MQLEWGKNAHGILNRKGLGKWPIGKLRRQK